MSSEGEEEIAVLPLDIQIEIMKRLPIKSLLKFKQVSKQWKSIIQSSRFISDYNKRIQPLNHLFVYDCEKNHVNIFDGDIRFLHRITAPMSAEYSDLKLIGYSQGLFGFRCHKDGTPEDVFTVVIWNPSIRKSVYIPVPENRDKRFRRFGFTVCNATDPTIFKIPHTHDCVDPVQVEIFKLSTGDWRTFSIDPPRESLFLTRVWKVVDRYIYWHAVEGNHFRILSFDIISQQFAELCLPPSLTSRSSGFGLGLSQHKESLVVLQWDVYKREDGVWMMMMEPGVQNSFRKLYTIKAPPYALQFSDVIGFRENGQPIIGMMLSENGWETTGPMYRIGTRMRNTRSAPHMNLFNPNIKLTFLFYEPDLERFNDIHISGYGSKAGSHMETLLLLDH